MQIGDDNGDSSNDGEEDENETDVSGDSDISDASSGWNDPNNYERLLNLGNQLGDVKTERWRLRAHAVIDALPQIHYSEILKLSQPALALTSSIGTGTSVEDVSAPITSDTTLQDVIIGKKRDSDAQELEQHLRDNDSSLASSDHSVDKGSVTEDVMNVYKKRLCDRTVDSHCSICMEPFISSSNSDRNDKVVAKKESEVEGDMLTLLPCTHYAHNDCVRGWMADNNSCPVCLREVSPS